MADAEAKPARGRCRVDTRLCFGNFKGRAVGVVGVSAVVRRCLKYASPERLIFAPDCGLSQTARWAARRKLANMLEGVRRVRREKGVE
jgi:hypothetical protein